MPQLVSGDELAGRYRLVAPIGRGGTGEVWAARDSATGTDIALKVIPPGSAADAALLVRQLEPEVRRLGGLVHPGILQVFAVHADGPWCCLSMERLPGGELGLLRGAGYREVAGAALEVLEALQYAHAQGVVHGDLKAGNVLKDSAGHWRLTDFRLAALANAAPTSAAPTSAPPVSLSSASPRQLTGAAPAVADDLYAFGALLYDLLAGQPPLHPGITTERIVNEVPARLGVDGRGDPLPPALVRLVAALLEKDPARRPASTGSVRAVLQEVLKGDAGPFAGGNGRQVPPPSGGGAGARSPRLTGSRQRAGKGLPASAVYVGAGLLAAGLLAAIFLLPGIVRERATLAGKPASPPVAAEAPAPVPPAPAPDARAIADEALARFVRSDDAAKLAGAARWGGADWLEARRVAEAADAQYQAGDYSAAAGSYRTAADRLQALADGAASQFAAALRAGTAALEGGDPPAATGHFERALQIRPDDPEAGRGLARSRNLGQVLALMTQAGGREAGGDVAGARQGYQAALALDGAWQPARAALARLDAAQAASAFERDMARGLAALAAGQTAVARAAIDSALRSRPGDPGALSALEQLNSAERRGRIIDLQAEAGQLATAEQWSAAVARYQAVLAIDPTLVAASTGLEQAQGRAALHQRLEQELARADRFNDEAIAGQARAAVAAATAVVGPGPVLAGQIQRLRAALATAARPVPVRFASDNQTSVTIFKVGPLGVFTDRTVELRPGPYVVVGTREGYRDVRRTIRVEASGTMTPVDVRCEEPI